MGQIADIAQLIVNQPGFDPARFDPERFAASLDEETLNRLYVQAEAEALRKRTNRYDQFFPDTGPLRRELYPKHVEFFTAGAKYSERLFQAGNRVGKTVAGSFEITAHTTGRYKDWWPGRRFNRPTHGWAAGDTNETTRDIIQKELFGEVAWDGNRKTFDGTGMIPKDYIGTCTWKQGVPNLADTVKIHHATGGWSTIGLKSYDQGRRVFQGTAKDWIWLDEEPPEDVYGECLIRLMTTNGIMLVTFTPLLGLSEVVMSFMPEDMRPTALDPDEF